MSKKNKSRAAVHWYLPAPKGGYRKRAFATSTVAESEMLRWAASQGATWGNSLQFLNYPTEAMVAIVEGFLQAGHGDTSMSEHIRVWEMAS